MTYGHVINDWLEHSLYRFFPLQVIGCSVQQIEIRWKCNMRYHPIQEIEASFNQWKRRTNSCSKRTNARIAVVSTWGCLVWSDIYELNAARLQNINARYARVGSSTSIIWWHIWRFMSKSRNIIAICVQEDFTDETSWWNIRKSCIRFLCRDSSYWINRRVQNNLLQKFYNIFYDINDNTFQQKKSQKNAPKLLYLR